MPFLPFCNRRKFNDVYELVSNGYEVSFVRPKFLSDGLYAKTNELCVRVAGPAGSPYEGGLWSVHISLPAKYPIQPPRVKFLNRIFHPNIRYHDGNVMQSVIGREWDSTVTLRYFIAALVELIKFPSIQDISNEMATALLYEDCEKFIDVVKQRVKQYATIRAMRKEEELVVDYAFDWLS